ncbi:MAG: Sjogren's syndrome/scleroderma autoantigen 1 family protein [Desulfurococcaceae archaeon]
MKSDKDPTKIMAELLKSGATMLADICPVQGCNLPLFKLRSGEIVCPIHGRVHVVKTDEEAQEVYSKTFLRYILDQLEQVALRTINTLIKSSDTDPTDLIKWLEVLERVERLKSTERKS